jgi:hypothetical protein
LHFQELTFHSTDHAWHEHFFLLGDFVGNLYIVGGDSGVSKGIGFGTFLEESELVKLGWLDSVGSDFRENICLPESIISFGLFGNNPLLIGGWWFLQLNGSRLSFSGLSGVRYIVSTNIFVSLVSILSSD